MRWLKFSCLAVLIALITGCASTAGRLAQPATPAALRAAPVAAFAAAPAAPATVATQAISAVPANDAAEQNPPAQAPKEELICRRETVVGSHFRERRCYTRAQLEEMQRQAGEFLDEEGRQQVPPGAAQ